MATVLNTIDTLEEIHIPVSQIAATHLVTYVRRMRRNTTNTFLSGRLRNLLKKWRDQLVHSEQSAYKVQHPTHPRKLKIRIGKQFVKDRHDLEHKLKNLTK